MTDPDISNALLEYLRAKTNVRDLGYAALPARMSGGYDASIFSFQMNDAPGPFDVPLVLRVLRPSTPSVRTQREAAVQRALAQSGYPAPRVLVVEDDPAILGGPFLIMERINGKALGWQFEGLGAQGGAATLRMLRQFPGVRREILRMWAEAQSRLHTLPIATLIQHLKTKGLDQDSLSFEAVLREMRDEAAGYRFDHLTPLLDWLERHKPVEMQPRTLCHGDAQPFNVLIEAGRLSGVIDWGKAVIADPALDYGAALAIFATVPVRSPRGIRFLLRYFLRGLAHAHTRAIRSERSAGDLAYYQVFNCATQLLAVSRKRTQGDIVTGAYNSTEGIAALRQHIATLSGLRIETR